jgi:Phage head-tail joining protein
VIGTRTPIGDRPHRLTLQQANPPQPDGDGGFLQTWSNLNPPQVWGKVAPAVQGDLERLGAGTVLTTHSRIVLVPYHPQLRTLARLQWVDRHGVAHTASVTGQATTTDETETLLVCEEISDAADLTRTAPGQANRPPKDKP